MALRTHALGLAAAVLATGCQSVVVYEPPGPIAVGALYDLRVSSSNDCYDLDCLDDGPQVVGIEFKEGGIFATGTGGRIEALKAGEDRAVVEVELPNKDGKTGTDRVRLEAAPISEIELVLDGAATFEHLQIAPGEATPVGWRAWDSAGRRLWGDVLEAFKEPEGQVALDWEGLVLTAPDEDGSYEIVHADGTVALQVEVSSDIELDGLEVVFGGDLLEAPAFWVVGTDTTIAVVDSSLEVEVQVLTPPICGVARTTWPLSQAIPITAYEAGDCELRVIHTRSDGERFETTASVGVATPIQREL